MSFLELNFLEVLAYVVLGAGGLIGVSLSPCMCNGERKINDWCSWAVSY
jgi:hypothetical protein